MLQHLDVGLRGLRPQLWPALLDVAEWSAGYWPHPALVAMKEVIAPKSEDITWSNGSHGILSDDIGADLDSDRIEHYLRGKLVRLLATLDTSVLSHK